ncbi:MAG: hypothetical protein IKQ46_04375 [Bacteroidales bacterium]|nr:hypothetical protein [Bacteroidales bacterium]
MKKTILLVSLCFSMMFTACFDNGGSNNNGGSKNSTTTTTTDNGKKSTTETRNSFSSNDGKFSINFPAPPAGPESSIEKNKAGLMQTFTYTLSVSDNAYYFAYYKDYPVGVITDSNTETMLKKEADNFMKNCGSSVAKSTEERLNGNKGLSFSGVLNDTININMRAFFVGKRYYQFGTMASDGAISDKDSKKFINSFEIVK